MGCCLRYSTGEAAAWTGWQDGERRQDALALGQCRDGQSSDFLKDGLQLERVQEAGMVLGLWT